MHCRIGLQSFIQARTAMTNQNGPPEDGGGGKGKLRNALRKLLGKKEGEELTPDEYAGTLALIVVLCIVAFGKTGKKPEAE